MFIDSVLVLVLIIVIARFIKRGSNLLQRFFIPSALIAGLGGLMLGPQVLGAIPVEIMEYWSTWPKYLISVVFAGLFLGKTIPGRKDLWHQAGPMVAFGNTIAWGQYVIGIILTLLILTPVFGANPMAGALIEIGFEGGHGTASGLAPSFNQLGWPEGADIALGLATISLIAAIASGVILINLHNRKHGYLIDEAAWKQQRRILVRSGYNLVRFSQKINTNPVAVATNIAAFAVAILLGMAILSGLSFVEALIFNGWTDLRFMSYVPLFPFAMIGGLLLQLFLRKVKKRRLIQRRTIQVISTIALDVLIVSAVATMSLTAIRDNLAVVILLSVAGIAWILGCFLVLAPKMFRDYWFEKGITNSGQSMGMTATGLLMNRLADPTNKSHAREGFAYKQLVFEPFMGGGLITATSIIVISKFGSWVALISATVIMLFWLWLGLAMNKPDKT